jgi:hypothetical protein
MPRSPLLARNMRLVFGASLIIGGLLHGSGYGAVVPLVQDVGNDAKVIFPALWLGYAWHYVMLGLIVLVVDGGWKLCALAALVALVDGLTQVKYFGFSPSEVVLMTIAALGAVAASLLRERSQA